MIRIRGPLEILQVTRHARGRGEVVVSVHVTLTALHVDMRPGQRERGLGVVKRSRLPGRCRMTHVAGLRNSCSEVIRIGRSLVVLQVTRHARGGGQIEIAVGVALIALQLGVSASKGKAYGIVVEICRRPG